MGLVNDVTSDLTTDVSSDVGSVDDVRGRALLRALVDIADGLVTTFDSADLLHRLTAHCVDLLAGGAAGILLADPDRRLRVVAASTEDLHTVELLAAQGERGPCVDCVRTGQPVGVPHLRASRARWPEWADLALAHGYRSAYATPMRLREDVIGALTIVATTPDALPASDLDAARALADVATITLLTHAAADRSDSLTAQLRYALDSRVVIEQAKGVVATAGGLTMEDAFQLLRSASRNTNVRLSELAEGITTGRTGTDDLQRWSGERRQVRGDGNGNGRRRGGDGD